MSTTKEIKFLRDQLAAQERENERLRSILRLLTCSKGVKAEANDYDMACSDGENEHPAESGSESDSEGGQSDGYDLPEAYWDKKDSVYRCAGCNGEVLESVCAFCGKENYVSDPVDSQPTDNQTMSEDRETNPRCTAPLLDIPLSGLIVPVKYQERDGGSEEYHQLLRRGATRIMCEQFSLSFSHERGIFAWANQDLFDEFSGEAMKEGDQWLIYLGRRIELDEEDVDGTDFIEGLLEDGALFAPDPCKWSTVKEGPNLWVTRPNLEIYEVDWDDEERDTANDLEEDDPRLENLNKNSAAEASPIENAYDAGDDDDMETSSVYTESSAEETDDEEGAADLCLYEVGISINTHGPDMDWEDDESSEGQSDTAASYEQDFDTDA